MRVDFYHLTNRPIDSVLPPLVERVLAAGGRLLIVSADETRRVALDRLLWTHAADSFLPHGLAGAGDDAAQPVLIAGEPVAANGARTVALVDGRWDEAALGFDRALHLFDAGAIDAARAAWKALAARDGVERNYWQQKEEGGWRRQG